MTYALFGFDYIFDFNYFRLAVLTVFAGLYIRFLFHFINSENWVKTFSQYSVFIYLPLTGFIITSVISDNIALSLGMVGALSIVRFRTPVKNPSELVVYFLLITVGIVTNVNPSTTITFLVLITIGSFSLEIYKFFTKKLNLQIFDFNDNFIHLNLVLKKELEELNYKNELTHVSTDGSQFMYKFQSNKLENLIEIKKEVEDILVTYSIDNPKL
jgi:hypothetical protein